MLTSSTQSVNSCTLAVYYLEDWTDDCKATRKDIDDYASAIFEGCQDPGNGKVGGKSQFGLANCAAQIEIITTSGDLPQGPRAVLPQGPNSRI